MSNQQLNLALEKYFKDEISERTKELEECKDAAFEIWDKICEIHKNSSPKSMKLYISGLKIILEYTSSNESATLTFPYNHPKILSCICIIAEYSDVKGKIFNQSDGIIFTFSYK